MKIIDMILNPKYAVGKKAIIKCCCPSDFGIDEDYCEDCRGMCERCWNQEIEEEEELIKE